MGNWKWAWEAFGKIYSGEETSESEEKEYEHLKIGPRRIYEKRAEGAIFRSKVRWIQEGKKLTKYLFNLEKKNFNKKVISELRMADGHVTINESQIMKEVTLFMKTCILQPITVQTRTSKSLQLT